MRNRAISSARTGIFILIALAAGLFTAISRAEELEFETLQTKYDETLKSAAAEYEALVLKLNHGYQAALERLKGTLGREGRLEEAGLVLKEIDDLKAKNPPLVMPLAADRRLRELRQKREKALASYAKAHNDKVEKLAKKYIAALDQRKRSLTRSGEIREALKYEEEIKRATALLEAQQKRVGPAKLKGKIVKGDVATPSRGAKATGATNAWKMVDGDGKGNPASNHSGHYAWSQWPCKFLIDLGDLYQIGRLRLHLFDLDGRTYKYRLYVSDNKSEWRIVSDRSEKGVSGWQESEFQPLDVRFIRIEGLHNTVNEDFHVLELEAFCPKK